MSFDPLVDWVREDSLVLKLLRIYCEDFLLHCKTSYYWLKLDVLVTFSVYNEIKIILLFFLKLRNMKNIFPVYFFLNGRSLYKV